MDSIFKKVESGIDALFDNEKHSHTHLEACDHLHNDDNSANRFESFAAPTLRKTKWYVDGCTYFWAVSEALERRKLRLQAEQESSQQQQQQQQPEKEKEPEETEQSTRKDLEPEESEQQLQSQEKENEEGKEKEKEENSQLVSLEEMLALMDDE